MKDFDWGHLGRLNMVIMGVAVVMILLSAISPLLTGVVLVLVAWRYPDLDSQLGLNNPSYLDKFSAVERSLQDERAKRSTRWAAGLIAATFLMRGLFSPVQPVVIPWYVWVFTVFAGAILVNTHELLRYRLALRSETYEQLYANHLSLSRLITIPFILAVFFGTFWILKSRV